MKVRPSPPLVLPHRVEPSRPDVPRDPVPPPRRPADGDVLPASTSVAVLTDAARRVAGPTLNPDVAAVANAGGLAAVLDRVAADGGRDVVIVGFDGTGQDNTGTVIDDATDAYADRAHVLYYPGVGTDAYHDRFGGTPIFGTLGGQKAKAAVDDAYERIARLHNADPDVKIVILGYSRGAAQAAELAARIDEHGIPDLDGEPNGRTPGFETYTPDKADLLLLVDPVYRMGNPLGFLFGDGSRGWDKELSVTEAHAYYARERDLWRDGTPLPAFLFDNTRFDGDHGRREFRDDNHSEIGRNPEVRADLLREINEVFDAPPN